MRETDLAPNGQRAGTRNYEESQPTGHRCASRRPVRSVPYVPDLGGSCFAMRGQATDTALPRRDTRLSVLDRLACRSCFCGKAAVSGQDQGDTAALAR